MPVGKAVDPRQRARVLGRSGGRGDISAGAARLALGQRPARCLGFGQRANVFGPQQRHQCRENVARGFGIAKRGVPAFDVDAEPFAQAVKTVVRQGGRRQPPQHAHIESTEARPNTPRQRVLPFQHGEVVVDGVTDDDCAAGKGLQVRRDLGKRRRPGHHVVSDVVNRNCRLGDGATGIDQTLEAFLCLQAAAFEAQGADLHDACAARIQARRFRVENDRFESEQRRRVAGSGHRGVSPACIPVPAIDGDGDW